MSEWAGLGIGTPLPSCGTSAGVRIYTPAHSLTLGVLYRVLSVREAYRKKPLWGSGA